MSTRFRSSVVVSLCSVLGLPLVVACPAQIDPGASLPAPSLRKAPQATEADPRVEKRGEDLYPAKTIERHEARKRAGEDAVADGAGLGSGRPDETNGVCRLFAPKLPKPECCQTTLGFDVDLVKQACGMDVYLGESFQSSCGFYFLGDSGATKWMRLSNLAEDTVAAAVKTHYRQPAMQGAAPPDGIGVDGVVRSRHKGLNWAFLPGWDGAVRLLTWRDDSCSDEGMTKVVQKLVGAKKPSAGAKRALVPSAQY